MTRRIRKTRLKPWVEKMIRDTGVEPAGSFEALYEEVDIPMKASETDITTLYKYRPLGDHVLRSDGTTATQDIVNSLKNCTLYAATPDELNDPFEVTLPAGMPDPEKYLCFMTTILEELRCNPYLAHLARDFATQIDYATQMMTNGQSLEWVQKAVLELLEEDFRKVRILSLTSKNNDPLMWSHYAAGHRGVCLGFRVAEGNIFGEALEVQYKRPPIYYTLDKTNRGRMQEEATLTKIESWSYEKEWRVIVTNYINPATTMRNLPFTPEWITEILFGSRVDSSARETILAATSHIPKVKIGYARDMSEDGLLSIVWDNDGSHLS